MRAFGMPKLNLIVRTTLCLLFVFLPLESMDEWFYDHFFRLRGTLRKTSDLVLVRVSDAKLQQLLSKSTLVPEDGDFSIERAHSSVWHRHFYETVLDKIEADSPKLVIFTSFFESVDTRTPLRSKYSNIILSSALNDENKVVLPPGRLLSGDNYGFNNIFPDQDNIVRRSHPVYSSANSLSLRAARALNFHISDDLLNAIRIDFRGPSGAFTSTDAWDIYEESSTAGRFRNKIVLIGREGTPASDLLTPFGPMSRLEIQANILDTIVGKRGIRILPKSITRAVSLVCIALSLFLIFYFPLTLAWLLLILLAILEVLVTLLFFAEFKIWYGLANPLFCIFGTHLLVTSFKLSRQEEDQWRIQQHANYLKEMDEFKNNFISLFSHDLKTPIAKIKAVIDRVITERKDLSPDVVASLKTIDRTNSELSRFISDILKVTKMEAMPLEPRKGVVDINRLVESSIARLKFLADEKKVQLVLDLEPLFSIEGDEDLLQEVIINLIENAIKYSFESSEVIVRTREENGAVLVTVIDYGIGIPKDEIPRVTGKFYRGKAAVGSTKGSGLGLYLAKYFVELHGGALEIKSTPKVSTEISVRLPLST